MTEKERCRATPNLSIHYDNIPDWVFGNSILDIGCADGSNALISSHKKKFLQAELEGNYLGLDVTDYGVACLTPIIISDIRDYDTVRTFDLVLCLHVVEHIPYEEWTTLFSKLRSFVSEGGYLVIDVPYNEPTYQSDKLHDHVVFHIKEKMLSKFLPDAHFFKYKSKKYPHWKDSNESHLKALVRFIHRIITRHSYRYRRFRNLVAVWKNQP